MGKVIDLTGQKFGKLTVLSRKDRYLGGSVKWECLCCCGNTTIAMSNQLTSGKKKSCGCLPRGFRSGSQSKAHYESLIKAITTHGKSRSDEYFIWQFRKSRHNTVSKAGEVFNVCDQWLESFENFYEDMGDRPSPKHQLIRLNKSKPFSKENCQWMTREEQKLNSSK